MAALRSHLRERRQAAGLTQGALAARAGVARQTVAGIEAGRYGPGVEVGLRLARALGCRVEDLFDLGDVAPAALVRAPGEPAGDLRVVLATVSGRPVARSLRGLGGARWPVAAADGVCAGEGTPLRRFGPARPALFLAGCDPALGLLAAHASRAGLEALWWQAGNAAALAQLEHGEVHAAGVHGPAPRRPGRAFRLGRWRMGFLVARGNPRGFAGAADLGRGDLRLANREPGSGARALLDALLAEAGVPPAAVPGYGRAFAGHDRAAAAVAEGQADVALGMELAAREHGLAFLPVAEEACELRLHPGEAGPAVDALLAVLQGGPFRADLAALGPYDTSETGRERVEP